MTAQQSKKQRKPRALGEEKCIRCGCTYYDPCPEGCGLAYIDSGSGYGICTSCVKRRETRKDFAAAIAKYVARATAKPRRRSR